MRRSGPGHALAGAALVAGTAALLWPVLEPSGRRGVLVAAPAAWAAGVVGHLLRRRWGRGPRGFLGVMAGGALLRMGVVAGAGIWVAWSGHPAPVAVLLPLAGWIVALLLLEPLFLPREERSTGGTGGGASTEGRTTDETKTDQMSGTG